MNGAVQRGRIDLRYRIFKRIALRPLLTLVRNAGGPCNWWSTGYLAA